MFAILLETLPGKLEEKTGFTCTGIGFRGPRNAVVRAKRMCLFSVKFSLKVSSIAGCFTIQNFEILSSCILKTLSSM